MLPWLPFVVFPNEDTKVKRKGFDQTSQGILEVHAIATPTNSNGTTLAANNKFKSNRFQIHLKLNSKMNQAQSNCSNGFNKSEQKQTSNSEGNPTQTNSRQSTRTATPEEPTTGFGGVAIRPGSRNQNVQSEQPPLRAAIKVVNPPGGKSSSEIFNFNDLAKSCPQHTTNHGGSPAQTESWQSSRTTTPEEPTNGVIQNGKPPLKGAVKIVNPPGGKSSFANFNSNDFNKSRQQVETTTNIDAIPTQIGSLESTRTSTPEEPTNGENIIMQKGSRNSNAQNDQQPARAAIKIVNPPGGKSSVFW